MERVGKALALITAVALVTSAVFMQWAWQLHDAHYLQHTAQDIRLYDRLAKALPDYASKKLPDPKEANQVFAKAVDAGAIRNTVDPLFVSISDAYKGKTDVVTVDISPIVVPVSASGYHIPPGTVFAQSTIQVGGAAPLLHTMQRLIVPSIMVTFILLGLLLLISVRGGWLKSLRRLLLYAGIMFMGLFAASFAIPSVVSVLANSNALDEALQAVFVDYIHAIAADAGRYYLALGIICLVVLLALLSMHSIHHATRRANRKKQVTIKPQENHEW